MHARWYITQNYSVCSNILWLIGWDRIFFITVAIKLESAVCFFRKGASQSCLKYLSWRYQTLALIKVVVLIKQLLIWKVHECPMTYVIFYVNITFQCLKSHLYYIYFSSRINLETVCSIYFRRTYKCSYFVCKLNFS